MTACCGLVGKLAPSRWEPPIWAANTDALVRCRRSLPNAVGYVPGELASLIELSARLAPEAGAPRVPALDEKADDEDRPWATSTGRVADGAGGPVLALGLGELGLDGYFQSEREGLSDMAG